MNEQTKNELPIGFGMALAMNEPAMEAFARMGEAEKSQILAAARNAKSKREMQSIVAGIVPGQTTM